MFRRKKKEPPIITINTAVDLDAAREDLLKADKQRSEAVVENHRARWTSEGLRKVREQNHFAPAIRASMLGEI